MNTTPSSSGLTEENNSPKANGKGHTNSRHPDRNNGSPRVLSNPNDIAQLVMMQLDAVNAKKDDLTIAIKGLADTAKQLVRAYAGHAMEIEKLQRRIKELEEKAK
jgi:hypothetical protein